MAIKLAEKEAKISQLRAEISRQEAEILQKDILNNYLIERIAWLERQKFGPSTERHLVENPDQLVLDLGLDPGAGQGEEVQTEQISYTRKKPNANHPGRKPLPEHLPRKEVIIEPAENTEGMKCIGEDVTELLAKVPAVLFVIRYIRKKYVSEENDTILMGSLPGRAIPKGIAHESLLADIVVSKYLDHLPLYRQVERLKRESVEISTSTMSDWVARTARLLEPLYEALKTSVTRYAGYAQADESPIKVLDKQKKGKTHQGYMWVYRDPGDELVLFDYRKGRGREGPGELLQYFEGHLQTDGYAVYEALFGKSKKVILMGCMAHARRYFFEAKESDPERAKWFLARVQKLYKIEDFLREINADHDLRALTRQEEALPILDEIYAWLKEEYPKVLPKSAIRKAIAYSLPRWKKLCEYAYFGMGEIDNNLIENQIRPLALGRKNYLFAGSHAAAQNSAILYSILLSAKQNKLNPYRYLYTILKRIPDHPINKIAELLPHNFQDQDYEAQESTAE